MDIAMRVMLDQTVADVCKNRANSNMHHDCHEIQFHSFQSSAHAAQLTTAKRAPKCLNLPFSIEVWRNAARTRVGMPEPQIGGCGHGWSRERSGNAWHQYLQKLKHTPGSISGAGQSCVFRINVARSPIALYCKENRFSATRSIRRTERPMYDHTSCNMIPLPTRVLGGTSRSEFCFSGKVHEPRATTRQQRIEGKLCTHVVVINNTWKGMQGYTKQNEAL